MKSPTPLRAVLVPAAVLGLGATLTGCGGPFRGSSDANVPPPVPSVTASRTPSPEVSGGPSARSTATNPQTCFDVVETYTGLVILPLTGDESAASAPQDQNGSALSRAGESVAAQRDRMPQSLRPAFDDAAGLLRKAGATLQPQESAQLQRSLRPVQDWISEHCSATVSAR